MIIFPAIDIKDKKVVRLVQGNFNRVTEYSENPLEMAQKWKNLGAEWLHIVDLDAAKTEGKVQNRVIILNIAKTIGIPVEVGGGIRTQEDIEVLIQGGVSRVIIGTKAVTDKMFLKEIVAKWKEKIAVSLDCFNGMLTKMGWTEKSNIKAIDFVKELEAMGIACIIYTDIARDGMLSGPNVQALEELLKKTKISIIASGGISNIDDIKRLKKMEQEGLLGIITGKAIYEGTLDLKEAIETSK